MNRIVYLGPEGSYSELAAQTYDPTLERQPLGNFRAIFSAVAGGDAELGIVPIENIIEGVVRENLDHLYQGRCRIQAEVIVPVNHCLASQNLTTPLARLVSHPQALAQCSDTLHQLYPEVPISRADSTAAALKQAAASPEVAAIGPPTTASQLGLVIRHHSVSDHPHNRTRFWIIGHELNVRASDNKFSLAFEFAEDRAGSLYEALGCFAQTGVNLTSISNRPLKNRWGNYIFHLDAEGCVRDSHVQSLLQCLKPLTAKLEVLGSYHSGELIP